jgi:hypothetical protein
VGADIHNTGAKALPRHEQSPVHTGRTEAQAWKKSAEWERLNKVGTMVSTLFWVFLTDFGGTVLVGFTLIGLYHLVTLLLRKANNEG